MDFLVSHRLKILVLAGAVSLLVFGFPQNTSSSSSHTYNFANTTNNKAYYSLTGSSIPRTPGDSSYTEYTTGEYASTSANDSSENVWNGQSAYFANLLYRFKINEATSTINSVTITWVGYNSGSNGLYLDVWNTTTANWVQWGSDGGAGGSSDQTYATTITSGISNYIDRNGYLNVGVAGGYIGGCFLAGTPIAMADGSYKNIEDVAIGDQVLAYNPATGRLDTDTVDNTFNHTADQMGSDYYVIINDEIKVTPNHPVYTQRGWVTVGDLTTHDMLLNQSGDFFPITSLQKVYQQAPVYNLEVTNDHDYFAQGMLAHNKPDILYENYVQVEVDYTATNPANNVTLTVTVEPYLSFSASATSTNLSPDMVDSSGNPHVASSTAITLTAGTNAAGGFSVTVADAAGDLAYGPTGTIASVGAGTTTIVAGTNGYGIQATSTAMTVAPTYDYWVPSTVVGTASSSAQTLASRASPGYGLTALMRLLAAATTSIPVGNYQDTITLTAVPTVP